ncbi:MAG: hypothetical protein RL757_1391, partial [Bacteroidota bacterium]
MNFNIFKIIFDIWIWFMRSAHPQNLAIDGQKWFTPSLRGGWGGNYW